MNFVFKYFIFSVFVFHFLLENVVGQSIGMMSGGYDNEEPLLFDKFPEGFQWGVATASYQAISVSVLNEIKFLFKRNVFLDFNNQRKYHIC